MYIELNKLYCMDNLELMKELPSESIDLIYGDILYGTGRDFGDYQDLPADRGVIKKFYIPRIKEMHRLLKDTGSIYLQMDYRINHWIRIILDDVFGYENFRNEIIWTYTVIQKEGKYFPRKHDNIYYYTKTNNYKYKPQYVPYKKSNKNNGIKCDNWEKEYKKLDERGKPVEDYWIDLPMLNSMSQERVNYQTQKPKKLLERIIKASSNKDDIIFDPFLGSGTTIVVAEELNRKWIGCDINPKSIEITNERLSKVQKRLF